MTIASSGTTINADADNDNAHGPVTARASGIHPAPVQAQRDSLAPEDEASALLRRSLEVLDEVHQLLRTLSPSEIETSIARMFLRRPGDADWDVGLCWRLYTSRHRLLRMQLFAQKHSEFARAAREHLARASQRLREEEQG
jgi:hypothetical protein